MLVQTILNRVEKYRSFVYEDVWLDQEKTARLFVSIRPRSNSKPRCSKCQRRCPGYDTLEERLFEFVPLWAIPVFFVYAMRRVQCPECGVVVEDVPWGNGKRRHTNTYSWFLASWARRLSWTEVARVFGSTWARVAESVEFAVKWGRRHMSLDGIQSIGIDEIAWRSHHRYLTVVYQIDNGYKRLLWVGQHRTIKTTLRFFKWLGAERASRVRFICSDMWKPYLKVIAKKLPQALHVLDRFHIMANMNKAIDDVRAQEVKRLKRDGYEPTLKRSRWLLIRRPENLTDSQRVRLRDLLSYNLRTVRAYLQKEDFQAFWKYRSPAWAAKFLDEWCRGVMRSRIEPMKKMARMLRSHRGLILNWFRARGAISSGSVEGLNNKAKVTARKSYGFRTPKYVEIALYHSLGELPEPKFTHRFW